MGLCPGIRSRRDLKDVTRVRGVEHDPEKRQPVFRKDHALTEGDETNHDRIQSDRTMSSHAALNPMRRMPRAFENNPARTGEWPRTDCLAGGCCRSRRPV